nr:MAG TPA: hypothetical protein [Caudoviricetes sp.]
MSIEIYTICTHFRLKTLLFFTSKKRAKCKKLLTFCTLSVIIIYVR